jgi:hypothetical protein
MASYSIILADGTDFVEHSAPRVKAYIKAHPNHTIVRIDRLLKNDKTKDLTAAFKVKPCKPAPAKVEPPKAQFLVTLRNDYGNKDHHEFANAEEVRKAIESEDQDDEYRAESVWTLDDAGQVEREVTRKFITYFG